MTKVRLLGLVEPGNESKMTRVPVSAPRGANKEILLQLISLKSD